MSDSAHGKQVLYEIVSALILVLGVALLNSASLQAHALIAMIGADACSETRQHTLCYAEIAVEHRPTPPRHWN